MKCAEPNIFCFLTNHSIYKMCIRDRTTTDLAFKCQCSKERIEDVLISLNEHDLKSLVNDGHAEVCCHFCGEKYQFNKDELTAIYNVSQKLKDNKENN